MIGDNFLRKENIPSRHLLYEKVTSFNKIIKSGFGFGVISKKDTPKEYFTGAVLNKLYSTNISLENILLTNDVFLSNYLNRYIYELYIKVFYIFSGQSNEEIMTRLNDFFENRDLKITEYQAGIDDNLLPPELKHKHRERYKTLSRIAHPNIESLNVHLDKTPDQQFDFLVPTINLILWHSIEIVRLFANLKLLNIDNKIDIEELLKSQK